MRGGRKSASEIILLNYMPQSGRLSCATAIIIDVPRHGPCRFHLLDSSNRNNNGLYRDYRALYYLLNEDGEEETKNIWQPLKDAYHGGRLCSFNEQQRR